MKNGSGPVRATTLLAIAVVLILFSDLREKPVTVSAQDEAGTIRAYRQKRWSFDIQNGLIRFSHGNHSRRDRWFRAYFGTGFNDCANCHRVEFPQPTDGTKVDSVSEIRKHQDNEIPYGIEEETCLICHNNVTAPNDCNWCHVQDSEPLREVKAAKLGEHEEEPDRIIPDYNENFRRDVDTIRDYREKGWFFDIENNNIRFSHGNHNSRDRFFNAYFGTGYEDCGNCHNLGLPYASADGVLLEQGEHLNTVEDIRDYEDDIYPFGIMMARCFAACHNGFTAPNDCTNCHLPGSKAVTEGTTALSGDMQNMVGNSIQKQMAGGTKEPGEKVYVQRQCSLCHILNETGAPIASDLTGIGSRREAGWLAGFLRDHQEGETKSTVPRLVLSDEEARSLARYLAQLKAVR